MVSCDNETDDTLVGNWVKLSDFEGVSRNDAVAFSIGNRGYIGTGYDGEIRLSDFWEYIPEGNYWTQKADFPGVARNSAVGFGTDTKGYIGTGYDGTTKLKDFWEFDPASNLWTQKADFAGTARYGSVAFSINNLGYIGTGYDGNYLKDFYCYHPETDVWEKIISFGGAKRKDAVAFVIGEKAYVTTGIDNGTFETDLWMYDPQVANWSQLRDIYDTSSDGYDDLYNMVGNNSVGFAENGKGYIATGGQNATGIITWEYDPDFDLWKQKTSFEGAARSEAASFSIENKAYILTGRNSSSRFDDIWRFDPNDTENEDD